MEAAVKCPKCKSKQHLHWISRVATPTAPATKSLFPSLKSVDFEKKSKIVIPNAENTSSPPSAPIANETNHEAPEIAPLPEIKENTEPKRETRPIFKAQTSFAASLKQDSRPIFRASRLQPKPVAKTESPVEAKPSIKPPIPAPITEIKIDDEEEKVAVRESHAPAPETDRHEVKVEIHSPPKLEPEPKIEERPLFKAPIQETPMPEPEPATQQEVKAEPEVKVEERPVEKPAPKARSMFRSDSPFKSSAGSSPRPLFKSQLKRDLKQSKPPIEIPEVKIEPEEAKIAAEPALESEQAKVVTEGEQEGAKSAVEIEPQPVKERAQRPTRSRSRKESMLQPRKAELEVRQSPLDDESEPQKVSETHGNIAPPDNEPKPVFPSSSPTRKKSRKKLAEEPTDIEDRGSEL